jgi:hypothetical protein
VLPGFSISYKLDSDVSWTIWEEEPPPIFFIWALISLLDLFLRRVEFEVAPRTSSRVFAEMSFCVTVVNLSFNCIFEEISGSSDMI